MASEVSDFHERLLRAADELGWKKLKSPEVYAEMIDQLGLAGVPQLLRSVLATVIDAAR